MLAMCLAESTFRGEKVQSFKSVKSSKGKGTDSERHGLRDNTEMPPCDDKLLWDVWTSLFHLPALTVADELGLFTFLDETPAAAEEVAEHFSLQITPTEALLGVLASLGFLVQHHNRFYLTEVSRTFLLFQSPYYCGGLLHALRDTPPLHFLIQDTLKRGSVRDDTNCQSLWGGKELNPEKATFLTQVMHSHSFPAAVGVARWGDFSGVQQLLDVGGGSGCFCIALAMRYPDMTFTILELPAVCTLAEQYIAQYNLQDRIDVLPADMFTDPWPSGHDAVLFSNIFHDWDIPHCLTLCQKSFNVLPPGGRIYLHEILLTDTKDNPCAAASYSLAVSLFYGNKLFTAHQLEELLQTCNYEDITMVHPSSYYSLISGRKL